MWFLEQLFNLSILLSTVHSSNILRIWFHQGEIVMPISISSICIIYAYHVFFQHWVTMEKDCFLVTGNSYQLLMAISGQVFKHDFSVDLNYVYWENSVFGHCSKKTSLEFQLFSSAVYWLLWKTWPIFRCLLRSQNLARNCFLDWPKYQKSLNPSVTNDKDVTM